MSEVLEVVVLVWEALEEAAAVLVVGPVVNLLVAAEERAEAMSEMSPQRGNYDIKDPALTAPDVTIVKDLAVVVLAELPRGPMRKILNVRKLRASTA